jgi:hypothetical protein
MELDYLPKTAAFSPPPLWVDVARRRGSDVVDDPPLTLARPRRQVNHATSIATQAMDSPSDRYFAQLAERHRRESQVWMAVAERSQVWMAVAERLQELRYDAESSGAPVSESSVHDFRYLLHKAQPARRPSIFLLDNGNIRALWLNDKKEQVGLQFLGEGEVQFVIFVQRPTLMARDHGTETLSAMFGRICSSGAAHLLA